MVYTYTGLKSTGKTADTTFYKLISPYGNSNGVLMSKSEIKQKLKDNNIEITNMKLTSDGRLIECKSCNVQKNNKVLSITAEQIDKISIGLYTKDLERDVEFLVGKQAVELKSKAIMTGANVKDINKHLFYLRTRNKIYICTDYDIFMLGSSYAMYENISCKSINFKNIDTSNLDYTNDMFKSAHIKNIDLSNLNMNELKDVSYMFEGCHTDEIVLRNIKFDNLKYANSVFKHCYANKVIIENIEAMKLESVYAMFKFSNIKHILIKNVKIPFNIDKRDIFGYVDMSNVNIVQ